MRDGSLNRVALAAFIDKDGRSLRGIAEIVGISGSYLAKLVKGTKPMKLAVALRISNALGIPLAAFFTLDPDLTPHVSVLESGGARAV